MKSDKELLKELVEYFDDVMVDVEEGKPFEKVEIPDYSGHELEFRIDMLIERFQEMMRSCLYTKDCLMCIIVDLKSLPIMGTSPQVKDFLEKLENEYKNQNDEKTREEIKKNMAEGLKEMEDSDKTKGTEFDTFESVLDEMKELHAKKDKDYGSAFHKSFEEFGATAGVVRLNDKMERVKSLVRNGKAEVKDESLLDSLKDMACYAVMLYVELKNKDNGKL